MVELTTLETVIGAEYAQAVAKISAPEIAAGTEAAVRRFSPADVKAMIALNGVSQAALDTAVANAEVSETNAATSAASAQQAAQGAQDAQAAAETAAGDAIAAQLWTVKPVKTANYALVAGDFKSIIPMNATSGPLTVTFGAAATHGLAVGSPLRIYKSDASVNAVTLVAGGATMGAPGGKLVLAAQFDQAHAVYLGGELFLIEGDLSL